jgi:hypothetical protein
VPDDVKSHITMIQPTTVFGLSKPQARRVFKVEDSPLQLDQLEHSVQNLNSSSRCAAVMIPACLRVLYAIGNYSADPTVNTIFGVSGFLEVSLDNFLAGYTLLMMLGIRKIWRLGKLPQGVRPTRSKPNLHQCSDKRWHKQPVRHSQ